MMQRLIRKFHQNWTSNILGTNLLTKFHEDRKINVASRVSSRKNASPPGSHVFQPTDIIFELVQDIIGINLLTKFHEDLTVYVTSRVLTRFYYSHIRKNATPLGSHVFQANIINFKLIQDIIGTNLSTKFHDDRKINVTSRVLTRKNAPPLLWACFSTNQHHFLTCPRYNGMNLLTEFHENRTINVASIVKNAPPLGSHVFQANVIIFELIQDINKTNLLTIFHEDWTINVASRVLTSLIMKNALPLGGHVFKETKTIFELIQDIIGTNLLTKFYEDQKINVASRVLTRKNAPPPGGHVFQPTAIIFELV
ncbi:hypothetical protein DPMN_098368 [Dreissena polymorpha]|uniref:Uncharacterized protein n=1 Tax=Dreissena polymorpha TaxID=45954 RepID=A0A9D4LDH2_DREPO|nr:hypothetical protein DPMN_098368 [Dreissena polymorpha]